MKKDKRNKEIIKLHNEGKTYDWIAEKFNITKARVGQIYTKKDIPMQFCDKHNKKYRKECPFCKIDKEFSVILENKDLIQEIEELKIQCRDEDVVRRRQILITKLIDEYFFSFSRVGQLLERDHSTIMHSYYSYKEEKLKNKQK